MVLDGTRQAGRCRVTRRRVLGTAGIVAATATAGCFFGSGGDGRDDGGADGTAASGNSSQSDGGANTGVGEYTDADVVEAVESAAVPLETTDPDAPLDDVTPVAEMLSGYSIVGLGEATHGTREFNVLRDRLIRVLVTEHGLRGIGVEDLFSEWTDVNRYVVNGSGTLDDAVTSINYDVWTHESMRTLLGWLRSFNEGRPTDDRVVFHGLDVRDIRAPAREILAYLERVDRGSVLAYVEDSLERFAEGGPSPIANAANRDEQMELLNTAYGTAEVVRHRMEDYRPTYVNASSEREYAVALHHVRALEQAARHAEGRLPIEQRYFGEIRDQMMAENTTWLLDHAPGDQVVFLGHNSHVKDGTLTGALRQGRYLRQTHGEQYYALGLTFGQGGFVARGESGAWAEHSVDAPGADTLEAPLVDAEHELSFLDFERAKGDPILADWLGQRRWMYSIGANHEEGDATRAMVPSENFDGLLFVLETTAEHRL